MRDSFALPKSRPPTLLLAAIGMMVLTAALLPAGAGGTTNHRVGRQGPSDPVTDLAATESVPDTSYLGQPTQFSATVTNKGPRTADGVELIFSIPTSPGMPIFQWAVASQGECYWGYPPVAVVRCPLGTVVPNQSITESFSIVPAANGQLSSTATVSGAVEDTDPDDDTGSAVTNVITAVQTSPRFVGIRVAAAAAAGKKKLRASGGVKSLDGYKPCSAGALVWVQHFVKPARWRLVRKTTTNAAGIYSVVFPLRQGAYRAVAIGSSSGSHACNEALSTVVRYKSS